MLSRQLNRRRVNQKGNKILIKHLMKLDPDMFTIEYMELTDAFKIDTNKLIRLLEEDQ